LLHIAFNTSELEIETVSDAHDILDKVLSKNTSIDSLRARYPEASKIFDEFSKTGRLPLLKIKIGEKGSAGSSHGNDPFGSNTTY
jgi:ribosomal protein L10